jgi:hypothetical protein
VKFLNFCQDRKACPFTVVVFPGDLKKMGDVRQPEGRQIEIKGTVQDCEGRTEIILRRSQQLGDAAFLFFPRVPTEYDVERQPHNSAGKMKAPKAAKKTETKQGDPTSVEDPGEPQQQSRSGYDGQPISHHPLAQLFQRILRPPPHNAPARERVDHRPQQYVHKQAGANRMQNKVIRWDGRPVRHSVINEK